jgi:hypothetical protein
MFVLAWRETADDRASAEKEARSLARWITGLMTRSNYSGRAFELVCPGSETRSFVEAVRQNPLEKETYRSLYDCRFIRYQSSKAVSLYTPQWSALVPAATIKVSRRGAEHFVIVSQSGRARTHTKPPP